MSSVHAYHMVREGYGPDDHGREDPQRGVDGDLRSAEMTESEKERIARLETRIEHLTDTIDKMSYKVDDLHGIMQQARGARWALLAAAGLAGFFGSKAGSWLWNSLPK